MLILSRKLGERIRIGEDVWVTIVDIDRGKIRLGINAPDCVHVMREELLPIGSQFNHQMERTNGDSEKQAEGKEAPEIIPEED